MNKSYSIIDSLDGLLVGSEDTAKVWEKILGMVVQLPFNEERFNYSHPILKLNEVSTIIMGQSPDSETYNKSGDGLPFYQGTADFGVLNPIARNWCTQPKKVAEAGDILIAVRAPIGPTNIAAEKCAIGRGLASIRASSQIDSKYLHYVLRASRMYLEGLGVGMTFTAIKGENLRDLPVPLPPLKRQLVLVEQLTKIEKQISEIKIQLAKIDSLRLATLKSGLEILVGSNL